MRISDWSSDVCASDLVREKIASAIDKVAAAKARVPKTQSEARKVFAAARRAEEAAYREAQRLRNEFLVRLKEFRVLDPACGSGNFLYVALKALKDIEHRANIDAETLGLDKANPAVGPENVLGIELNRKSGVEGKSVSVRGDFGGGRVIKKK